MTGFARQQGERFKSQNRGQLIGSQQVARRHHSKNLSTLHQKNTSQNSTSHISLSKLLVLASKGSLNLVKTSLTHSDKTITKTKTPKKQKVGCWLGDLASKQKASLDMKQTPKSDHEPVLMAEVLQYLNPHLGDIYLDVTAGYGGHAREVIARTKAPAVLVDRDHFAIDYLAGEFEQQSVELVQRDFLTASQQLQESGRRFDLILADLGVSSPHLNMASRGFSIQREGPLDMRMDNSQALNAATIINTYSEAALIELIRRYGEEPSARRIAKAIVQHRPIGTTIELADLITSVVPRGRGKVHPATRTFQALRIAVNDELGQLEQVLPVWNELLRPGGRLVVISFHSLEDRLVKQYFQTASGGRYDSSLHLLTKRPATASHHEIAFNPRARSAKLRAAVKTKT